MRKKLIELLTEPIPITKSLLGNEFAPKMKMGLIFVENVADHLIANGVTIPTRCKDCKKEWCYLRQELGPDGFCSAGERNTN